MIYTIGGIKGGSGKTTIAVNLTVLFSIRGYKTLLIDADDQGSATDFTTWRTEYRGDDIGFTSVQLSGTNVRTQGQRLHEQNDVVVIDTGGRDTTSQRAALSISDIAIFPFPPRAIDIWTLENLNKMLLEVLSIRPQLKICFFINRADPNGNDNVEASESLKEYSQYHFLDVRIGNRKAFSNGCAIGESVMEMIPSDIKACAEIEALFQTVTGLR